MGISLKIMEFKNFDTYETPYQYILDGTSKTPKPEFHVPDLSLPPAPSISTYTYIYNT